MKIYAPIWNKNISCKSPKRALDQMIKLGYDAGVVNQIRSSIMGFMKGSKIRRCSPLYNPKRNYKTAIKVRDLFDSQFKDDISKLDPRIVDLEEKEKVKFHSFSQRLPYEKINKGFLDVLRKKNKIKGKFYLEKAFWHLHKTKFKHFLGRCRPLSLDNRCKRLPKDSQWRLPFMKKGHLSWKDHLRIAKKCYNQGYVDFIPAIFGMRNQPGADDIPKQRIILLVPHFVVILETIFSRVLTGIYKTYPWFGKLKSQNSCDSRVTEILERSIRDQWRRISVDFSIFGYSLEKIFLFYYFLHIKLMFGIKPGSHLSGLIHSLYNYLSSRLIVLPDLTFLVCDKGINDGSGFTSSCGCFSHMLVSHACFFYLYGRFPLSDEFLDIYMSDDGIWYWYGILVNEISIRLKEIFGLSLNVEKCYVRVGQAIFCSSLYIYHYRPDKDFPALCRPIRSIYRTLVGNTFKEKGNFVSSSGEPWSDVDESLRWITQLENVKFHPLGLKYVKFIAKGDFRFALGIKNKIGVRGLFCLVGGFKNFMNSKISSDFKYSQTVYSTRVSSLWINRAVDQIIEGDENT